MPHGNAPISGIYRLGEAVPVEQHDEARREREQALFTRLWRQHGLFCIREDDLPQDDPLAQHVINIANQKYGRRHA